MRRFIPHPLLMLVLFITWLLLTQSFSFGQMLLGAIVAFLATHALAALQPEPVKLRHPVAMVRLLGTVVADIVRSNFAVASLVLFRRRDRVSGFIHLPLDITHPYGLAVLAVIITATPGSLWVEFDGRRSTVLVHVLDLIDEEQWVALIKQRYESLLLEIFGR